MKQPLSDVLRYLHRTMGRSESEVVTDGQLLERFASRQDEAALELLVRRHAGLVWGVCRRGLGDTADAEDAMQATFLVLVRKARTLDRRPSLTGWLYGVALRVVQKARCRSARRQQREGGNLGLADVPETSQVNPELRELLDAELDRLPDKYRAPLVLCYFQGKTNEEAARELGCSAGLVAKYLARGRERLRERLRHPSLAATTALLGTAAAAEGATTPPALIQSTIQAVLPGGEASGGALVLSEGVLHTMFLTKLKKLTTMAAACFLLAGGGWLALAAATQQEEPPPAAPAPRRAVVEPVAADQPLTPQRAAQLKQLILPQPGENPFWRIAWHEDVWEARQLAAKEGKPLFVWGGSEGAPITNC